MPNKEIEVHLPYNLIERVESRGINFEEWSEEAFSLAFFVEKGLIYQKVGEDYLQLRMKDFEPLAGKPAADYMTVPKEIEHKIMKLKRNIPDWALRAFSLMLVAENITLFTIDEGEYQEIQPPSLKVLESRENRKDQANS